MWPTFTFDDRTVMAEVDHLSLHFQTAPTRAWTLRDQFVEAMRDPLKAFRGLADSGNRFTVLNDICFQILAGDRIGVLGVNGVGKTTLCRCLAGAYNPSRGRVRRFGRVRAVFDTSIGMYPELTGRENARLLMHFLYPEDVGRHAELMNEAMEFSELGEFLDRPYKFYSNGMQARLCLSLISCLPSDILVLDEVFDGADQFFRDKVSARILAIIEQSRAVVFVSHSAEQIQRVCNRVILLNQGRLAFDGDVETGIATYRRLGGS